jgi:hypothetical protein
MDPLLAALVRGEISRLYQEADGRLTPDAVIPSALLSGSFNPLHNGHRGLADAAARRVGMPVAFELAVINADKPPLDPVDMMRRLSQFVGLAPVWLTNAPTFAAKARLFPGAIFVVGADTAERVIAARFYANSTEIMRASLADIRTAGCRFLVAGRKSSAGRFVAAESLALPAEHRDLFDLLPESAFRHDLSSSQLRCEPDCEHDAPARE